MSAIPKRHGVAQCSIEHFERDFGDRHRIHDAIAKWARETPDVDAIVCFDTGRSFTYRQFQSAIPAVALRLLEMGFRKGDFLATSLPLIPEHVVLEYACFAIGVIHAPLDLRLKAPEVIRSLELIRAKGYAFLGKTPFADFSALGSAVQANCPYVEHLLQFVPPGETLPGARSMVAELVEALTTPWESINPRRRRLYEEAAQSVAPTDGAQVIYTTGSTGMPKPALLSHRNATCQNMCLSEGFGMDGHMRMLVNLPPSHVGCQTEQLMTTFFVGGTAILLSMFDPEKSLQAIERYKVNVVGQIPALFALEWRLPTYAKHDLSSLQFVLYGGQQVSREFLERLSKMAPKFGTGLGLTEMAGFVTYTPLDGTVDDIAASIGYDMPVTPLSIRQPMRPDGAAGDALPPGEVGEICFSGPQVFIDYVNNPEAYRKTVSTDGVCYTGDLGYFSPKGLCFSGRSKFVIKPKGYQVHPAQVEEHFSGLTECVQACAAVGAPHEVFSEAIVLFVETKPGVSVTIERFEAHAREIAAYMRPSHYVLLETGGLPLNRVAKTDYVQLRDHALREIDRLRSEGGWDR